MRAHPAYRRLCWAAIVLTLLGTIPACQRSGGDSGDVFASAATVKRGNVATVVQMAGQVVAANALELDFGSMSGRLAEVAIQPGQEVEAGQELMRLETVSLERALREAQADLQSAAAALLAAQQGAGPSELARAEADLAYARYQVDAARLELEIAEKRGVQGLRDAVADAEFALRVAQDELRLKEIGEGLPAIRALEYEVAFFERLLRDLPADDPQRVEASKNLAEKEQSLARARRLREDALAAARDVVDEKSYALARARDELQRALSGATDPANSARLAHRAAVEALESAQRKVDALRAGGESETVAAARTAYEAALSAVEAAQAALDAATLRAPFSGIALGVYVNPNDTVAPGQKVAFLADLDELRLDAQVSEVDVPRIAVGQDVRVSFAVYPGQLFFGKVLELPQQTSNQSGIVQYRVIASLDPRDTLLWLGMYGDARVVIGERQDVLTMPAAAVRYDEMGEPYVSLRRQDGTIEKRKVELGMNDGIQVEVLSGLNEGDTVMVPLVPATSPYGPRGIMY